MKQFKNNGLGLFCLILVQFCSPFLVMGEEGIFEVMDRNFNEVQSFSGTFTQVYFDSLQEKEVRSTGTVAFKRPGLMRWNYTQPEELLIVVGSKKVWIVDPILENVTIQSVKNVSQMNVLSFLLEKERFKKHFRSISSKKTLLEPDPETIQIALAPVTSMNDMVELHLAIDKTSFQIKQFALLDKQGNQRKVRFSELTLNPSFSDDLFFYQVPDGMEIIDGMEN